MLESPSRPPGDCRFVIIPADAGLDIYVVGVLDAWTAGTLVTIIEQNRLEPIRLDLTAVTWVDAHGCATVGALLARRDVVVSAVGPSDADRLRRHASGASGRAPEPGLHAVA